MTCPVNGVAAGLYQLVLIRKLLGSYLLSIVLTSAQLGLRFSWHCFEEPESTSLHQVVESAHTPSPDRNERGSQRGKRPASRVRRRCRSQHRHLKIERPRVLATEQNSAPIVVESLWPRRVIQPTAGDLDPNQRTLSTARMFPRAIQ